MTDSTLNAYDDERGGERVNFIDYLEEGAEPELYSNPDEETGWYGIRKLYRDASGEWRLRHLTAAENRARTERILDKLPTVGKG